MSKEKRDHSASDDICRGSPVSCSSSKVRSRSSPKHKKEYDENVKEWEDARCPVCMEHPHNAVLLLCSSHEKGCRPFMCDTSYRHSNCLDQFRKSFPDATISVSHQDGVATEPATASIDTEATAGNLTGETEAGRNLLREIPSANPTKATLTCPLCRGKIIGWIVVEPARHFMNAKYRSCACEACDFSGTYSDLRKHARVSHPLVRPSVADPERQRSWRRLERQRDFGDLISTLQSSIDEEREEEGILPIDEGMLTVYFLIRVFRPRSTSRSSSWSGASRGRDRQSVRRRLTRHWGESYENTENNTPAPDDDEISDGGSVGPWTWSRRTRRRTTPEEQQ
ncbi:unnamed protein product [Rhodiola kirilowii]